MDALSGKRIACYVRVSTEDQKRHGLSIDAQTAALTAWANEHKCKIVGFYNDAGLSARKKYIKRPEMVRLLDDIRAGKIDMVVFTKLDRWFRNLPEYYKVQEILEDNHVTWNAIHEDYETETASGRLKVNIMLAVNQDEADRDSERIRAVMQRKREKGELLSGSVPYGYKKVGEKSNSRVEFDEEEKETVQRFFDLMLSTNSVSEALRTLEAETGKRISKVLAYRMRTMEAYTGNYHGLTIPAYISMEQHNALLSKVGAAPKVTPSGRVFIFSGLLYCNECGARMAGHAQPHKNCVTYDYKCRKYSYNGQCNNQVCIMERTIEEFLLLRIEDLIEEYNLQASGANEQKRKSYQAEIAAVERKIQRLKELYIADLISMDSYKEDYIPLKKRLDEMMEQQSKLQIVRRPSNIVMPENWKDIYSEMSQKGKQEFWHSIFSKVYVDKKRKITVEF